MSEKLNLFRSNVWVPLYPVELLPKPNKLDTVVTHMPVYRTESGGYTIPVGYSFGEGERRMLSLLAYRALSASELYYLKIFDPNGDRSTLPTSIDAGTEKPDPIEGFTVDLYENVRSEGVKAVSIRGKNIKLGIEESLGLLPLFRGSVEKAIKRRDQYYYYSKHKRKKNQH